VAIVQVSAIRIEIHGIMIVTTDPVLTTITIVAACVGRPGPLEFVALEAVAGKVRVVR